jgi:hypothetical protein
VPAKLSQTSFIGGEISPKLHAHSDLDKYRHALQTQRNFYTVSHGSSKNRAGMRFVGDVYHSPVHLTGVSKRSRLIEFSFSDEQTYVLEIAEGYTRIIKDEALLARTTPLTINGGTDATPVVIDTSAAHGVRKDDLVSIRSPTVPSEAGVENKTFYADRILIAPAAAGLVSLVQLGAVDDYRIEIEFGTAGGAWTAGQLVLLTGFDVAPFTNQWLNNRVFEIESRVISGGFPPGDTIQLHGEATVAGAESISAEEALKFFVEESPPDTPPAGYTIQRVDELKFSLRGTTTATLAAPLTDGLIDVFVGFETPWLESELREIKYTQSADALTLTHKNHPPIEIKRGTSHEEWFVTLHETTPGNITEPTLLTVGAGGGAGGGVRAYVVTAVDEKTGNESRPTSGVVGDRYGTTLEWGPPAIGTANKYWVYAGDSDSGQFGLIGLSNGLGFDLGPEPGITPEWTISYFVAQTPFDEVDSYPRAVAYFQDRLAFASTISEPQLVILSAKAAYRTFGESIPVVDSDAIFASLLGREQNPILHMIGISDFYLFTSGGVWVVTGNSQNILTATGGFNAKMQSNYGSSEVRPLQIGEVVLYVQSDGCAVRDLAYVFESDRHAASDLTILSKHLLEKEILEWAYAAAPDSVIWCVRDDGTMITLTYYREHKIFSWARHDTDGIVESVASVLEGRVDKVYVEVERNIDGTNKRFIEVMGKRDVDDVRDAFQVDSGLSYVASAANPYTAQTPLIIDSVTKADPVVLNVTPSPAHVWVENDLIDVEHWVKGTDGAVPGAMHNKRFKVEAGVTATEIPLKDLTDVDIDGTTEEFVGTAEKPIAEVEGRSGARRPDPSKVFGGADHLIGEKVSILRDGHVEPRQVVDANGEVTVLDFASRVHLGKQFTCDMRTLQPFAKSRSGTIQGVPTLIGDVTLRVDKSRGGFLGSDETNLKEIKQRTVEGYDAPIELLTGELKHAIGTGWRRGEIMYRQTDPLPVEILALIFDVEFGQR